MLRMRRCRADGVIWANFHPCLLGAAGSRIIGVLLAITAKKLLIFGIEYLPGGDPLRRCGSRGEY